MTELMVISLNEVMIRVEETSVQNKILSSVFDHVMWELPMEHSTDSFHPAVVFMSLKPRDHHQTLELKVIGK